MNHSSLLNRTDTEDVSFADRLVKLNDLSQEDQAAYLKEQEEKMRLSHQIDRNVYLLRGTVEEAIGRALNMKEGMYDIDGTLTGIGDRTIYDSSIRSLNDISATGVKNSGLTGRHRWQVEELWDNHPKGFSMEHAYIEQGFYSLTRGRQPELFAGDPAIADNVNVVREKLASHLAAIEAEFGVQFVTTSAEGYPEAHRTMYSIDAHVPGGDKIEDKDIATHEAIMQHLDAVWSQYDPRHEIAKLGTSSTGTFEFTPDGLNKERTMQLHMSRFGLNPDHLAFFGDSGNDMPVFNSPNPYTKSVIVKQNFDRKLMKNAHFAAVGTGNASPILDFMNRVRRKGA
jgi:HAD superfamily hydrolase (TIGR01484 family)